ncbi:translin-associated factor X S homeolog [Xenopus laevis]|uniref:Translin-associated protein X n=2 Tax=Xenopus laevis TaxID=8355 RepID=Q7SZ15_XENLA|nr:translin-associated factor X S homeolog [Xenopus laevis]AAH54180.1 MGC64311 protein [Xenopus laevis]OCT78035.1 hypothetical protein XELAEV_18029133mg [Xenopus laevis]
MSAKGSGSFKNRKPDIFQRSQRKDEKGSVHSSSAVVMAFKDFQSELDARHDKYERLVKLGRDITIESKRTIFLLHRIMSDHNKEDVLSEAETKLLTVRQKIREIAEELVGEDMYQYHRAFTPGLQEYVEAITFKHFIESRTLVTINEINKQLIFEGLENMPTITRESFCSNLSCSTENDHSKITALRIQVTPVDYLLGVADLTGELMRYCISSVGNGDIDTPFELSCFLRQVFDGFAYIGNTGPYEISRKIHVLKQSLSKVENACYALKVRGSEIPKHMLADVFSFKSELIEIDDRI